jgi:outer membrane protein
MVQIFKKNTSLLGICLLGIGNLFAQEQKVWSLQACVEQALSKNITVQQQILTTQSSKADYLQSKMALLPNLNANATNNWQTGFAINPATNLAKEGVAFRTNSFGLSSSMPLFSGFQNINNVRVQEERMKASEKDLEQTKNTITLNVCNAFLRVFAKYRIVQFIFGTSKCNQSPSRKAKENV